MARKKATKRVEVENYSHNGSSRKNIPPAKIAGEGEIPKTKKAVYSYSPHLPPHLRFDSAGGSDRLASIVEKACAGNTLSTKEQEILRAIARNAEQPWLEWSGKLEENSRFDLEVDPVALHIHERISSNAIVRAAMRDDVQRELFGDPELAYKEAVQFYRHDVDWANRLILGDSLQAMSSLAHREDLAGKVKMIYIDPPYGIKFASNFQPEIGVRDVKDKESDLTREIEMVKAYRDTWHLGIHSYLSYIRERLVLARELLSDSGSIFLQISNDNVHRIRILMDEVFGDNNCVSTVAYKKGSAQAKRIKNSFNYLLWYAKDADLVSVNKVFRKRRVSDGTTEDPKKLALWLRLENGFERPLTTDEKREKVHLPDGAKVFRADKVRNRGSGDERSFAFDFNGETVNPGRGYIWRGDLVQMERLRLADRLLRTSKALAYKFYLDDSGGIELTNLWIDTAGKIPGMTYAVQTHEKVIERCILMSTKPGDLVLDPTCGSGTTAYVAEQWGRRWITIDTSRVGIALARQRLLTAQYHRYRVRGESPDSSLRSAGKGIDPSADFQYPVVSHITRTSIACNENLDPIFAKYEHILEEHLASINRALKGVSNELRGHLACKYLVLAQEEGPQGITEADRRRLLLPGTTKEIVESACSESPKAQVKKIVNNIGDDASRERFEHWNIPFDIDPDWPNALSQAVTAYRGAWQQKIEEVNNCIDVNSDQEALVDQPKVAKGVVRVAGPFTVEGIRPEELSINEKGELFDPTPNEWDEDGQNASAYLDRMLQLLRKDGVTFPNNEHRNFTRIESLYESDSALHAEGTWESEFEATDINTTCNVAIAFGPQYGPVTAEQVEDLIRASRRYDELVIAAFSFDGASQEIIQESANPRLKIHMAHIRPDVSPGMDGLLKDTPNSQLFTVFGQPEIEVRINDDGEVEVELLGVDIYSPLTGEIHSAGAAKVAAWFLDSDYDSRCFCVTQAFFPNQKAWDKIAKALGTTADTEAFDAYKGTVSIPFAPGKHRRIAVKVIDPRGNEVMAIRSLEGGE